MSDLALHPWLDSHEAVKACEKAVAVAIAKVGQKALRLGRDELLSQAYVILAECASEPNVKRYTTCAECEGSLEGVRAGSKFCSNTCSSRYRMRRKRGSGEPVAPEQPKAHLGAMWSWPEGEMSNYAIREVAYCLNNYATVEWTRRDAYGTPASDWLDSDDFNRADDDDEPTGPTFYEFRAVAGGVPGYLRPGLDGNGHGTPVAAYPLQGIDLQTIAELAYALGIELPRKVA